MTEARLVTREQLAAALHIVGPYHVHHHIEGVEQSCEEQARNAFAALPAAAPASRAYCGDCDGVGWYEGGETLQTQCERCYGTGWADGKP
jgi:hypothetical protein